VSDQPLLWAAKAMRRRTDEYLERKGAAKSMNIVITEISSQITGDEDYRACLEDNVGVFGEGGSPEEAVGVMVLRNPQAFNVTTSIGKGDG
jgi:hypothetical protein